MTFKREPPQRRLPPSHPVSESPPTRVFRRPGLCQPAGRPVPEQPDPAPVPVVQVVVEVAGGFVVRAGTTEGRRNFGIAARTPDLIKVLVAQALGDQPVGPEGDDRLLLNQPRCPPASRRPRDRSPVRGA